MLCVIAHVVLQTILHTVEVPIPNSSEIVLYSMLVAKRQIVTAICLSTDTGIRYLVIDFSMYGFN